MRIQLSPRSPRSARVQHCSVASLVAIAIAAELLGGCARSGSQGETGGSGGRESAVAASQAPVLPTRSVAGEVVVLQHGPDAFDRAPKWSLESKPIATAGGAAGVPEFDLTGAGDVEILSDGRLVTLAMVGNRLLLFAADGRGERSLGRQGKGPGEIMAPTGMAVGGADTLILPDPGNQRLNWIVADKGVVSSKPLPAIRQSGFIKPVGLLRDGRVVMSTSGLVQDNDGDSVTRPPASIVVLSRHADSATVVASIPDLELVRIATKYRGRPGWDPRVLRFSRRALAVAWDSVIATGSGDGYQVDLRDPAGKIHGSIRVAVPRRVVTPAMRDAEIGRMLRLIEGPHSEGMIDPAETKRIEQAIPSADSLPPYRQLFVTPNRTLWVVDGSVPDGKTGAATAFRQDGAILGRLSWRDRGLPVAFADDRVVMRDTDEDGVVSLHVYAILRRLQ